MSSMWRTGCVTSFAFSATALGFGAIFRAGLHHARYPAALRDHPVGYALNDWRRLRQSSGYAFADYARFLIGNPGWPGRVDDAQMGRESDAPGRESR